MSDPTAKPTHLPVAEEGANRAGRAKAENLVSSCICRPLQVTTSIALETERVNSRIDERRLAAPAARGRPPVIWACQPKSSGS